jgi:hypothetical protein
LYSAKISTLRNADQKDLERFETRCWRMMEKISWTDCVKNKEVLGRFKGKEQPTYNRRQEDYLNWPHLA